MFIGLYGNVKDICIFTKESDNVNERQNRMVKKRTSTNYTQTSLHTSGLKSLLLIF